MKLLPFQRRDFAAAALLDGVILSLEQGLGKSFAAFTIPYIWRAPRCLIVAPGDLHPQLAETAALHFGLALPALATPDDLTYHRLHLPPKPLNPGQQPSFFITSYEALTRNGADEWPSDVDSNGKILLRARERARLIEARALAKAWVLSRLLGTKVDFKPYMEGVGSEFGGITCVWKPSMARILKQLEGRGAGFDCIVLDEATYIQGDSLIAKGVSLLAPRKRLLLTGTPVKNRLESIFTLAWWATGAADAPTTRWPYKPDDKQKFAKHHLEVDRFLTREEEKAEREGKKRNQVRLSKTSPRVCNVQRLWRLLSPVVLRRRKADCGLDIVPKTIRPITIQLGTAQSTIYKEHLEFRPTAAAGSGGAKTLPALAAMGMQITNLRQAALCPDAPALADVVSNAHPARKRSWTPWTPKLAACLSLIADLLDQGEQVMIGSPFTRFSTVLHELLTEARVASLHLDGTTPPRERGLLAAAFKRMDASVLVAGLASMARGHSFENCSHLILPAYSWAMDENAQFIDRIWRLNSLRPVTIYTLCAAGTIDERLAESFSDKADTAQLTLDGRLFPETIEDLDPELLLAEAYDAFQKNSGNATIEESLLEAGWPGLAKRLRWSQVRFNEFHPPLVAPIVTAADLIASMHDHAPDPLFDHAIAKERFKQDLAKLFPK